MACGFQLALQRRRSWQQGPIFHRSLRVLGIDIRLTKHTTNMQSIIEQELPVPLKILGSQPTSD